MKFYDDLGNEADISSFEDGSLVVARVTKKIDHEEMVKLIRANEMISKEFSKRGIALIWCPEWLEFKEWK